MLNAEYRSKQNRGKHAAALVWTERLEVAHSLVWLEHESVADEDAAGLAVRTLFAAEGFPVSYASDDLLLLRDPLGKPYVYWQGEVAQWATDRGYDSRHLHITNTHDGGAHIILAAYGAELAGIGIDAVYLPRLRTPRKDAGYLRRFAAHFMSIEEQDLFEQSCADDKDEQLRLRVAAHFSLMEAASKALGTGLKIGGGMGRPESLPKQSLGVRSIAPEVEMLLAADAARRMEQLSASRCQGYWSAGDEFLISAAMLW